MKTSPAHKDTGQLPEEIRTMLDSTVSRIRRILILRGTLAVLSGILLVTLAIMTVDLLHVALPTGARWLLTAAGFTSVGAIAYWYLYRPLAMPLSRLDIAHAIETRNPGLHERISSTVQLLNEDSASRGNNSTVLVQRLVGEAMQDAAIISPSHLFTWRTARRFGIVLASCLAIYLVLFAYWPAATFRLMGRAVVPFSQIGNAYAGRIRVIPGNTGIAIGETLTIEAILDKDGTLRAELHTTIDKQSEWVESMRRVPTNTPGSRFAITIPTITSSFHYRIRAGRALTQSYAVQAFPRPTVTELWIRESYPAYAGLEPRLSQRNEGTIDSVAGTTLDVFASVNIPIRPSKLVVGETVYDQPEETQIEGRPFWRWSLPVYSQPMTTNWHFELMSTAGYESTIQRHPFIIRQDRDPVVSITEPTIQPLRLPPDAVVKLTYIAVDDFGVASATLKARFNPSGQEQIILIPPPLHTPESDMAGRWTGSASFDLAAHDMQDVTRIAFYIEVKDTCSPALSGPNPAKSDNFIVEIDRQASSWEQQVAKESQAHLSEVAAEAVEKTGTWQEMMDAIDSVTDRQTMSTLAEISKEALQLETALTEAAEAVDATALADAGEALRDFAANELPRMRKAADDLLLADSDEQEAKLAALQDQLLKTATEAAAMQRDVNRELAEDALEAKAANMAAEQAKLAETAKLEVNSEAPLLDASWQDQQKALAELAKTFEEERDARIQEQTATADALAKEAISLADMQERIAAPDDTDENRSEAMQELIKAQQAQIVSEAEVLTEAAQRQATAEPESQAAAQQAQLAQQALEQARAALAGLENEQMETARAAGQEAEQDWSEMEAAKIPNSAAAELARDQAHLNEFMRALDEQDLEAAAAEAQAMVAERARELAHEAQERMNEGIPFTEESAEQTDAAIRELKKAAHEATQAEQMLAARAEAESPAEPGQGEPGGAEPAEPGQGEPGGAEPAEPDQGEPGGAEPTEPGQGEPGDAEPASPGKGEPGAQPQAPGQAAAQAAAQSMRAGAEQLQQLAQALNTAPPMPSQEAMQQAAAQAAAAAEAAAMGNVPAAAAQAGAAAEALQAAEAQMAPPAMGTPPQIGNTAVPGIGTGMISPNDTGRISAGTTPRDPALGKWIKAKQSAGRRAEAAEADDVSPDYRELVNSYFRELAAQTELTRPIREDTHE